MQKAILALVAVALAVQCSTVGAATVIPNLVTKNITFSNFSSISVDLPFNVLIVPQNNTYGATLQGEQALVDAVGFYGEGGNLVINVTQGFVSTSVVTLRVYLPPTQLAGVAVNSSSSANVVLESGFVSSSFTGITYGAASLTAVDLVASKSVYLQNNGYGAHAISGVLGEVELVNEGVGIFELVGVAGNVNIRSTGVVGVILSSVDGDNALTGSVAGLGQVKFNQGNCSIKSASVDPLAAQPAPTLAEVNLAEIPLGNLSQTDLALFRTAAAFLNFTVNATSGNATLENLQLGPFNFTQSLGGRVCQQVDDLESAFIAPEPEWSCGLNYSRAFQTKAFGDIFSDIGNALSDAAGSVANATTDFFSQDTLDTIVNGTTSLGNTIVNSFTSNGTFGQAANATANFFVNAADKIKDGAVDAGNAIADVSTSAFNTVVDGSKGLVEDIGNFAEDTKDDAQEALRKLLIQVGLGAIAASTYLNNVVETNGGTIVQAATCASGSAPVSVAGIQSS